MSIAQEKVVGRYESGSLTLGERVMQRRSFVTGIVSAAALIFSLPRKLAAGLRTSDAKLSDKEKKFTEEYLRGQIANEAAEASGYSVNKGFPNRRGPVPKLPPRRERNREIGASASILKDCCCCFAIIIEEVPEYKEIQTPVQVTHFVYKDGSIRDAIHIQNLGPLYSWPIAWVHISQTAKDPIRVGDLVRIPIEDIVYSECHATLLWEIYPRLADPSQTDDSKGTI